ncbi:nucleotidyltransferase domain-containing protein [Streptomyces sp. CB04723]|uniref:DNA polymerase beta superfamily protein n=1 Tax=Streptomyces TaxID=1883 RepID=UPI0015C41FF0|nr:nucleotidyltransferase domain-containing protein [Streptomyces sp. CB04723]QLG36076.1 nucleotidyltransferase domain-containing protein [Streptomyces sp. CB04723]
MISAADEALVRDHTVYACVMGSRAFGLATEDSDTDRRGVFLAPTPLFWRFDKPPTHVVGDAREELLAVRRGEVSWPEVERRMDRLGAENDEAAARTPLPPEPDRAVVEDFLVRTRRASAARGAFG